MKGWTQIALPFVFGIMVGVAFAFFLFESRIRFYREFIEHRLTSINRLRSSKETKRKQPKSSFWKAVTSRRSKPREESKPSHNK
jgi:hypothetical protein